MGVVVSGLRWRGVGEILFCLPEVFDEAFGAERAEPPGGAPGGTGQPKQHLPPVSAGDTPVGAFRLFQNL